MLNIILHLRTRSRIWGTWCKGPKWGQKTISDEDKKSILNETCSHKKQKMQSWAVAS